MHQIQRMVAVAFAVICCALAPAAARAATYSVNLGDNTNDGACAASPGDCTLREAINAANLAAGSDNIVFSGVTTVTVSSPETLPVVTETVEIFGGAATSCGGGPTVTLSGHSTANGLTFADGSDGSRVCRMIIGNWNTGIDVQTGADGVRIDRNRIGTTGAIALPQARGIQTSAATIITTNVISGNTSEGVTIGTGAAIVRGNAIGTSTTGTAAIPNGQGVSVSSPTAVIGGAASGQGNVISGNSANGVVAYAGTIIGNFIGVDESGALALPNAFGVIAPAGSSATIGGPLAGEGNVISGNTNSGVHLFSPGARIHGNLIGTNQGGTAAVGNGDGIAVRETATAAVIGGAAPGEGNLISGNTQSGIYVASTGVAVADVAIVGNTIGLNRAGTDDIANQRGVRVGSAALRTRVGTSAPGDGNRIAGNALANVEIEGVDTQIEQNTIGLGAGDQVVLPNPIGIRTTSTADGTVIGGSGATAGNTISGNSDFGIILDQGSERATIQGNRIGLAADGTTVRDNETGLQIDNVFSSVQVGGTAAGAGNVISGNSVVGVSITGGASEGVVLEGNRIGTDATGVLARGNARAGILLGASTNARIGGGSPGAANVISGNIGHGIEAQTGVDNAVIEGNLIGLGADGTTVLGNTRAGIAGDHLLNHVTVGGTAPGTGNTIRHNGEDGISVGPTSTTGQSTRILGNAISDNAGLGIDLGNNAITPNDAGDADLGDNGLQNFPIVADATTNGLTTTVSGTLDAVAGRTIRIELFSSATCDPSGNGEGEVFLGHAEIISGSGATPFQATGAPTLGGRQLTTTATDLTTGETSEFSACRSIAFVPPPTPLTPGPSSPLLPTAPTTATSSTTTAKRPAKLKVRRAGIDAGTLDMLVEITSTAATAGAKLDFSYESSGRTTRFSLPITTTQTASGGEALITVRKKLPSSQPKDTGIVEISYAGNSAVSADEVRLRAADVQATLVRSASTLTGGRLKASGTISAKARGVVRLRFGYSEADGSDGFVLINATIAGGRWSVDRALTGAAAAGGYLSIQFTGYEAAGMRGEQTGKQLP